MQAKVGMGVVWPGYGEGLLWLDWRVSMMAEKVNRVLGWITRVVKMVSLLNHSFNITSCLLGK